MIPITPQPEPIGFNASVRLPGSKFLAKTPHPSAKEFQTNNYWKNSINDLYLSYKKICAYSSAPIWHTGSATVDHYLAKSVRPDLAYEWNNFRLARFKLNYNKDINEKVIDPFTIEDGWFQIDFPSCLIKPGTGLSDAVHKSVVDSIRILKLNDDDELVQERATRMTEFAEGEILLSWLEKYYPLLAKEIVRQGIQNNANSIFKTRSIT
ncbi:MAG: hypothetical protein I8H91_03880 [Burkholderiales bacterium]|nr:hypothetical protein [Burkholderiales bacterium]